MEVSLPQLILPIKLERSSERLTSLGGLVVMEELARAVGLWKQVDGVLEGPKSGRGYQPHEFVQGLIWMLHAGGLRRQGEKGAAAIEEISRKLIAPCLELAEEVTLDVDATEIAAEKQEAQWTYHHVQGYMPLRGYVEG